MNRFTAIDFETANKYKLSACALGIVVFENGMEITRQSVLIKPPSPYDYFDPINVRIHQITSSLVVDAPSFYDVFKIIEPHLKGSLIIAHNADFDLGILSALISYYHCELPAFYYGCTVQLSRKAFEGLSNYKLNTVAETLGLNLTHHDALSDALACANIMLTTMVGMEELNALKCFSKLGVSIKQII